MLPTKLSLTKTELSPKMTSPLPAAKKRNRGKITRKRKKRFSYEYMMKSCLTWEYDDTFSNIESWDDSLKGDPSDKGVIELSEMKNEKENEALVSSLGSWDESLKGHADKGVIENESFEMKNVKENEQVSRQLENFDSQSLEDCSANEQVRRSATSDIDGHLEYLLYLQKTWVPRANLPDVTYHEERYCQVLNERKKENVVYGDVECQPSYSNSADIQTSDLTHDSGVSLCTQEKESEFFECYICKKLFFHKSRLNQHLEAYGKKDHFHCSICTITFKSKEALEFHSLSCNPTNHKPFNCRVCTMPFDTKWNLRVHDHMTPCGKKKQLSRPKHWMHHVLIHGHQFLVSSSLCQICWKSFWTREEYDAHLHTHNLEELFLCSLCSRSFQSRKGLMAHSCSHKKEVFPCSICSKTFSTKRRLERHLPHHITCSFCKESFPTAESLKRHLGPINEKPFHCSLCNKSFRMECVFRRHMLVHNDN